MILLQMINKICLNFYFMFSVLSLDNFDIILNSKFTYLKLKSISISHLNLVFFHNLLKKLTEYLGYSKFIHLIIISMSLNFHKEITRIHRGKKPDNNVTIITES